MVLTRRMAGQAFQPVELSEKSQKSLSPELSEARSLTLGSPSHSKSLSRGQSKGKSKAIPKDSKSKAAKSRAKNRRKGFESSSQSESYSQRQSSQQKSSHKKEGSRRRKTEPPFLLASDVEESLPLVVEDQKFLKLIYGPQGKIELLLQQRAEDRQFVLREKWVSKGKVRIQKRAFEDREEAIAEFRKKVNQKNRSTGDS